VSTLQPVAYAKHRVLQVTQNNGGKKQILTKVSVTILMTDTSFFAF
jgi:hypothetical protein